jgi:hypothetical protein
MGCSGESYYFRSMRVGQKAFKVCGRIEGMGNMIGWVELTNEDHLMKKMRRLVLLLVCENFFWVG